MKKERIKGDRVDEKIKKREKEEKKWKRKRGGGQVFGFRDGILTGTPRVAGRLAGQAGVALPYQNELVAFY